MVPKRRFEKRKRITFEELKKLYPNVFSSKGIISPLAQSRKKIEILKKYKYILGLTVKEFDSITLDLKKAKKSSFKGYIPKPPITEETEKKIEENTASSKKV